ncbi:MAG: Yop proteins translocation protein L [Chlamydiae bacterium]|nr:Yop proteins translocation protein L [Chlamydiota bacterium]
MKVLTLISKKEARLAPGIKMIPQEDFSQLIEAKELLEEIKKEGIEHRADIAKEGERLFEESKEKGFKEGLDQWANQIKLFEKEKEKVRKDVEKVIAKIALITTKKIIGRELAQDSSTVVDIIAKNLKSVASHKHVSIFVNKQDLDTFQEHREKLKAVFEQVESFAIQAREDISIGGAIIETESGIIDSRIESLWATIENTFEDLLNKKKK